MCLQIMAFRKCLRAFITRKKFFLLQDITENILGSDHKENVYLRYECFCVSSYDHLQKITWGIHHSMCSFMLLQTSCYKICLGALITRKIFVCHQMTTFRKSLWEFITRNMFFTSMCSSGYYRKYHWALITNLHVLSQTFQANKTKSNS